MAQDSGFDRSDLFRSLNDFANADGVVDGHAVSTENDLDMGSQTILQAPGRYQPFFVSAGVPFYYTSNAALKRSDASSDFIVAPFVHLEYQPQLAGTLFAFASLDEQFFFYARNDDLDFAAFNGRLGINYYFPGAGNLVLRAYYEYIRLTDTDDTYAALFQHGVFLSAELPFTIDARQQIALGLYGRASLETHPAHARRQEIAPYVNYRLGLTPALSLDVYAELALREYNQGDRRDATGLLALAASYRLTRLLTVSARGSFAMSRSNQSINDYNVANLGGMLELALKF